MKRIPMILAVLAAVFLVVCHIEYGFRGLNPDVESDWVLRPAWWQSDRLADCGFFLLVPTIYESGPLAPLLENERATFIFFILSQLFTITTTSLTVFYISRLLLKFAQPKPMLPETPNSAL